MTDHTLFLVGLCFLLAHEMDAIRVREWKVFPGLNKLRDEAGYVAFTALHVPIYALLLCWLYSEEGMNIGLVVGLDVFIIHVLLHLILYNHPENRFRSLFSYALILGAGLFSTLDLLTRL